MNNTNDENKRYERTCVAIPPRMYTIGMVGVDSLFKHPFAVLQLQILVIFILTHLLHFPLKKFRFPKILAEIIAGVLLGPTMPKVVTNYTYKLFPSDTQETIDTLSLFGYAFLLFLIGVKSDVTLVKKAGKKEAAIGIFTFIVPLIMGTTIVILLVKCDAKKPLKSLISVVQLQSLTPFSGIALLLKNLKLLNSELGRLALSSAAVTEILNVSLVSIMSIYKAYRTTKLMDEAILDFGLLICFLLVVVLIVRPVMIWIVKQTPEGRDVGNEYLYAFVLLALVACVFTHIIDQNAIFGAFVIGLAIPDGPPIGSCLVNYLDSFISGLLVPLFVTIASSKADLKLLFSYQYRSLFAMLVPLIFSVKLLAGFIPALICKVPFRDALALGLIMCTKGVVELATYSLLRDEQTIKEVTMGVVIITIAVTALVTTTSVRKLYNPRRKYAGYESRNIMHTKMDAELKIVACIHRQDNINGFINLIDASGPTRETPMAVFVLHLIELRGRASPIFISHQLQKKSSSGFSYSEDILLAFDQLERRKEGAISTQCFTAISPRKVMYEDICTLALDKLASFLIVPFHRKWDVQGSVEAEDNVLRTLIGKILDRAPCSVGIFVDRGLVAKESSYSVAMIFIGGNDDREALTYAKRIAKNPSISLTVIHFVVEEDDNVFNRKERMLDDEVLKDVKFNNVGTEFVFYVEEKVNDGPETALVVRSMMNEYDLIIVGRNNDVERPQTSGLSEWSEFPELGIMGDFLGSVEGKYRASVLVIQQQKQMIR